VFALAEDHKKKKCSCGSLYQNYFLYRPHISLLEFYN